MWAMLLIVLVGISSVYLVSEARSGSKQANSLANYEINLPLPDFSFTERSGKTCSKEDLIGNVWIADFIFTSCAGPCPLMSERMQHLQRDLAPIPDLRLVSFSVDPVRDTPEVLQAYADRYQADGQRWLFLTGPLQRIYDIAIDGFRITVEAARENNQIIHDTRFILVDRRGAIRGYYDSNSPDELQRLRKDAAALASASNP